MTEYWIPKSKFNIYRRDRTSRTGGGVCIFVSNTLMSSCINIVNDNNLSAEIIGCTIHVKHCMINIYCIYCPPNIGKSEFGYCLDILGKSLSKHQNSSDIIVGDFNLPGINWDNPTTGTLSKDSACVTFCQKFGLNQINRIPTRGNNILDLILTNDPLLITSFGTGLPLGSSDHDSVYVNVILVTRSNKLTIGSINQDQTRNIIYLWSKADWTNLNTACFHVDWYNIFTNCANANDCWKMFSGIIDIHLPIFVPSKKRNVCLIVGKTKTKFISKRVRRLTNKKRKLWKKRKNSVIIEKYKQCIALIKQANRDDELDYESKIIKSGNVGAIYKHINSRLVHKTGIAPLIGVNHQMVFDDLA